MSRQDYIQATNKAGFEKALKEGKISEEQIGFIEEEDLIWAKGNYYGAVPDNEDLTKDKDGKLQFSDRSYNPANFSGKGYKILRRNIVQERNVLTQEMMAEPNTIYEIRYDFDLSGETINVPEGCVLKFEGGSLKNGTLNNIGEIENKLQGNVLINSFSNKITKIKCSDYGVNNQSDPTFNQKVLQAAIDSNLIIYVDNGRVNRPTSIDSTNSITLNTNLSIKNIGKFYGDGALYFPNSEGFIFNGKSSNSNGNYFINIDIRSKGHCFNLSNNGDESRPQNIYISTFQNLSLVSDTESCIYGSNSKSQDNNDVLVFDCLFDNIWFNTPTYAFEDITGNLKNKINRVEGIVSKAYFKNFSPQVISNCNTTYVECEWFMYFTPEYTYTVNTSIEETNIETYTKGIFGCDLDRWDEYSSDYYASLYLKNITFLYKDSNKYNLNIFTFPYLRLCFDGSFSTFNTKKDEPLVNCKNLAGHISYNNTSNLECIYIKEQDYSSNSYFILKNNRATLNNYDNVYRRNYNALLEYSSCKTLLDSEVSLLTDEDYLSDKYGFYIKTAYNEINTTKEIHNFYTKFNINPNTAVHISHPLLFTILNTGSSDLIFRKSAGGLMYDMKLKPNTSGLFCFIPKNKESNRVICLNVYDENIKIGVTSSRPINPNKGFEYYDTDLNKDIIWNGTTWVDSEGNPADALKKGTTSQRPTGVQPGFHYFDTDLGHDMVWDGQEWYDPTNKDEFSDLYKIMYNQHASVSVSSNVPGNIIEKGVPKAVTLSWNYIFNGASTTPDTLQLKSGQDVLVGDKGTKTYTDNIQDTKTYQVVSIMKGVTKTAGITINAYYPIYYGGSSKTTLTSDDVLAFTKHGAIKSNPSGSYNFQVDAGEYAWICVPAGMVINKVTSNGFGVPIEPLATVAVTGKGNYNCYRSSETFTSGMFSCVVG